MISVDEKALIKKRNLMTENWDPWIDEGYADASSNMMVPKTEALAVSCRIIRLEPGDILVCIVMIGFIMLWLLMGYLSWRLILSE